jgi:hypothetical protein
MFGEEDGDLPSGLVWLPGALNRQDLGIIEVLIKNQKWFEDGNQFLCFGNRNISPLLLRLLQPLLVSYISYEFDHLLANHYEPGQGTEKGLIQGIKPHVDLDRFEDG